MQSDFDRLLFFEHARKTAEAAYAKDPLDTDVRSYSFLWSVPLFFAFYFSFIIWVCLVSEKFWENSINVFFLNCFCGLLAQNLTRWGGALLELSQFQTVPDSKKMILGAYTSLYLIFFRSSVFVWITGNYLINGLLVIGMLNLLIWNCNLMICQMQFQSWRRHWWLAPIDTTHCGVWEMLILLMLFWLLTRMRPRSISTRQLCTFSKQLTRYCFFYLQWLINIRQYDIREIIDLVFFW